MSKQALFSPLKTLGFLSFISERLGEIAGSLEQGDPASPVDKDALDSEILLLLHEIDRMVEDVRPFCTMQ